MRRAGDYWRGFVARVLSCCAWMSLVCCLPGVLQGSGGGVNVLPVAGKLRTSGVEVEIDSRWVDSNGYRPVRIEIRNLPLRTAAPADRRFRVVVKPLTYYGGGSSDQISQIIDLEQGATKAVASIAVPQDAPWHAVIVDVYEDGRLLDDLSGDHLSWPRGQYWNWNEATPCVLVVDSKAPTRNDREILLQLWQGKGEAEVDKHYSEKLPDIRNLLRQFPDNQFQNLNVSAGESRKTHAVQILNELKDTVKADILRSDELPERWIEFSSCDLIIISLADLADLAKRRPKVHRAVADWVRAGQTLIVYDSGEDFAGLSQIEQLLQLPAVPKADEARFRGWRQPAKGIRNDKLRTLVEDGRYYGRGMATTVVQSDPQLNVEVPGTEGNVDKAWAFVIRDAGLGQVVAFDADPFPGSQQDWAWMLNSLRGNAWNPTQRSGISQQQRNEDFWNFLIPGTGQAPVFSFLVFITLFVMLIGPVNYISLQRSHRLYLLLITVPLGSFLVTGGLFLYAMFTDGLGVKSRTRSYTWLDQRSGNVASTSRQAYYASIAPSQGFEYRDDTVVQPFLHDPTGPNGQRTVRRRVHWDEHDQQLRGGYIHSRTLSQVLVTRSGTTKARLRVGQVNGDRLPITNELDTTLAYLLVTDEKGDLFAGSKIGLGKAELSRVDPTAAEQDLSKRLREFTPEYPEGYSENMHDSPFEFWQFGPRSYNRWGNNTIISQTSSHLERNLARFSHLGSQPLAPRSYVALCDNLPEVPLGVPRTRQYISLHVLEGNW
jgi:hypothetical protein